MYKRLAAFTFIITSAAFANANIDAIKIVKIADEKRGLGNISQSFNATVKNNNDQNIEVYSVKLKDINASIIEQIEPARSRGKKILMKNYDIWLYSPDIKKPIRISLEQKLTGQIAYGDIARTNYSEDYNAQITEIVKIKNLDTYKISLTAKNKNVTYDRIEYFVDKESNSPIGAIFYAISGKPLKRAQFADYKMINGKSRSTTMTIYDYLQQNRFSKITFSNHKAESFKEKTFNKDNLEF